MVLRTTAGISTQAEVVISPATSTSPVVVALSQATRAKTGLGYAWLSMMQEDLVEARLAVEEATRLFSDLGDARERRFLQRGMLAGGTPHPGLRASFLGLEVTEREQLELLEAVLHCLAQLGGEDLQPLLGIAVAEREPAQPPQRRLDRVEA